MPFWWSWLPCAWRAGDGLRRVAERAVLNANWIRRRLSGSYDVPFDRPCMHEVVLSAATLRKQYGTKALDVAKYTASLAGLPYFAVPR